MTRVLNTGEAKQGLQIAAQFRQCGPPGKEQRILAVGIRGRLQRLSDALDKSLRLGCVRMRQADQQDKKGEEDKIQSGKHRPGIGLARCAVLA